MDVDILAITSICCLFVLYGKNILVMKEDLLEQTDSSVV